jgi:hypothetical protein
MIIYYCVIAYKQIFLSLLLVRLCALCMPYNFLTFETLILWQ